MLHSTMRKDSEPTVTVVGKDRIPLPAPDAVRGQLERLLASARFASSVRCQTLLRHLVEEALRGDVESLKERNLGIELFHRDAGYDTNADPVVRIAASEVRKKLAQYYFDPANRGHIRIAIPVGSYVPEFTYPDGGPNNSTANLWETTEEHSKPDDTELTVAPLMPPQTQSPRRRLLMWVGLGAGLVILCAAALTWRTMTAPGPLDEFWAPLVASRSPILLCLGQMQASQVQLDPIPSRNPGEAAMSIIGSGAVEDVKMPIADLDDAITLANIAGLLRSKRRQLLIRPEAETSYEDLQKGPVVLVGALNNDWTLRLMRNMRYQFNENAQLHAWWVSDQKNPGARLGLLVLGPKVNMTQDLAVVARVLDPETKQPTIIVAGVAPEGTLGAGNFVTDPQYWKDFAASLPRNWQSKNLEILLSVNVIDSQPGPPRVLSTVIW